MKLKTPIAALALTLVAVASPFAGLLASPANAASGVSIDVDDFVYRSDGCYDVPGTISVSRGIGYDNWDAEIDVTGPRGEWADFDWVSSSGTRESFDALFACFYIGDFGKHTVRAEVTFYDDEYNVIHTAVDTDTFTVQAGSALKKTRISKLGRTWEVRGRLAATGGVTPTKNHPIRLQKLKSGAWRTVESVRDGKGGQIVLRYRGPKAGKSPPPLVRRRRGPGRCERGLPPPSLT